MNNNRGFQPTGNMYNTQGRQGQVNQMGMMQNQMQPQMNPMNVQNPMQMGMMNNMMNRQQPNMMMMNQQQVMKGQMMMNQMNQMNMTNRGFRTSNQQQSGFNMQTGNMSNQSSSMFNNSNVNPANVQMNIMGNQQRRMNMPMNMMNQVSQQQQTATNQNMQMGGQGNQQNTQPKHVQSNEDSNTSKHVPTRPQPIPMNQHAQPKVNVLQMTMMGQIPQQSNQQPQMNQMNQPTPQMNPMNQWGRVKGQVQWNQVKHTINTTTDPNSQPQPQVQLNQVNHSVNATTVIPNVQLAQPTPPVNVVSKNESLPQQPIAVVNQPISQIVENPQSQPQTIPINPQVLIPKAEEKEIKKPVVAPQPVPSQRSQPHHTSTGSLVENNPSPIISGAACANTPVIIPMNMEFPSPENKIEPKKKKLEEEVEGEGDDDPSKKQDEASQVHQSNLYMNPLDSLPPPARPTISDHELSKLYLIQWTKKMRINHFTHKTSLRLEKNEEVELQSVPEIQCCLKWKTTCDLDCSVMTYDHHGAFKEAIFFKNLHAKDKTIIHYGDNRTGEGDGDDEVIYVNLKGINKNITTLLFTVSVYSKFFFRKVEKCQIRLVYLKKKGIGYKRKKICKFKVSKRKKLADKTSLVLACVYRKFDGTGDWRVRMIGKSIVGRHVGDQDQYKKAKKYIPLFAVDPKAKFHAISSKNEKHRWNKIRKSLVYRRTWIEFKVSARKLPKMDLFGSADPYFEIYDATTGEKIVKSSIIKNTQSPNWEPMKLVETNAVMNHPLEIRVWDWDRGTKENDFIGKTQFHFNQFFVPGVSYLHKGKRSEVDELECSKMEFLLTHKEKERGWVYLSVKKIIKDGVYKPVTYQKIDHYFDEDWKKRMKTWIKHKME